MKCRNCGAEGDGKFCEHCGTSLTQGTAPAQTCTQANDPIQFISRPETTTASSVDAPEPQPVPVGAQAAPPVSEEAVPGQVTAETAGTRPPADQTPAGQSVRPNPQPAVAASKPQSSMKKKPIFKKWWFWGVASLVVIAIIVGATSGNKGTAVSGSSSTSKTSGVSTQSKGSATASSTVKAKVYKDGTYLVGKDIEAGLYKATLTDTVMKMGYIERSKGVSMSTDDILANIILNGNGYVEIKSTDAAVKLQGVSITKTDLNSLKKDPKEQVSDGMYLVGYDIKPGTYKVEVTDTVTKMGYVERTKSASMDTDDILANEIYQGPGYVEIKDTDFAIRVQGAKLTLQQ